MVEDDFDPFDLFGDSPEEEDSPESEIPEKSEDEEELDLDFAPDIPNAGSQNISPTVSNDPNELDHEMLRRDNVPPENQLQLPEMNLPANATPSQRKLVEDAMKDVVLYGARASAMVCAGQECPYAAKCPLIRARLPAPIGEDCPVEMYAMKVWMQGQLREMEVNPHDVGNFYDLVSSQAMTGLLLQIQRARWGEAMNPVLEQNIENTITKGHETIVNIVKSGNYNTDYREKALKLLDKMARNNMQTRERKVALTNSGWKDKSKHAAEVAERISKIKEEEEVMEFDENGMPKSLSKIKRFHKPSGDESS